MTTADTTCTSCQHPLPLHAAYCPVCGYKQQQEPVSVLPSERRLVTILFADLASFTDASRDADPEDVTEMLNHVFTRLMAEGDREDGYLDKTVGDQLMVLFGVPRAHEDDPVRAVRAALGMQEMMNELASVMRDKVGTACKLHIGINTGLVVWGQVGPNGRTAPTVIGDAVNLACRLQSLSEGGQILVSESVYLRTREIFDYNTLKPIQVKGKPEPVPVFAPLRLRQSGLSNRHLIETSIPLTERNRELEILQAHWARAREGDPQIVLITGDAGLGKTRLLVEFAGKPHSDVMNKKPQMLVTSSESASDEHYRPLTQLISMLFGLDPNQPDMVQRQKIEDRTRILGFNVQEYLPLLGYLLGWYDGSPQIAEAGGDPDRLNQAGIEATINVLLQQSTRRPMLVAIDDLQWADASTINFLNRLAIVTQSPEVKRDKRQLMVLAASRPQGGSLLDSMALSQIITLAPLSDLGRQDLIHALLPGWGLPNSLIDRLVHESGGNPFYLIEVIRRLIQSGQVVRQDGAWQLTRPVNQIDVPPSVEGLVMATLDSLDPETRSVLQHASVIGPHFSFALLAGITPINNLAAQLDNLEQRGLISQHDSNGNGRDKMYSFAQRLVREVVYNSILRRTRRQLHDQIARLTEAKNNYGLSDDRNEAELETVAYHYASGSQSDKIVTYNYLLGIGSLNRFQFDEAYHHLQLAWEALAAMEDPDPDICHRVVEAFGDASTFTGDYVQARLCYEVMRDRVARDPKQLAAWYHRLGRLSFQEGNAEIAVEAYCQALAAATPEDVFLTAQVEAELRLMFDQV